MSISNIKINPSVSFAKYGNKNGMKTTKVDLFTVLNYYNKEVSKDSFQKGKVGTIYAFNSDYKLSVNGDIDIPGDGIVFLDIDNTKEYSDIVMDNFNNLCNMMPNLLAITKSYSGNLHVFCYDSDLCGDEVRDIYTQKEPLYLAIFAWSVFKLLNIDFRNIKNALDTHNANVTQPLFMTYSPFKWNEYCTSCKFNNIEKLRNEYPDVFKKIDYCSKPKELQVDWTALNVQIDNVDEIEHLGYSERMYLFSSLSFLFDDHDELMKNWIRCCNLFKEGKHRKSYYYTEPIRLRWGKRICKESLLNKFGYSFKKQTIVTDVISSMTDIQREIWHPTHPNCYEIPEGKYLSETYYDLIKKEIDKNDSLVIKGGTGIGKTVTITKLAVDYKGVVIVPFISLKTNYSELNIVERNEDMLKSVGNCMTYDRFSMIDNKLFAGKTIFVDESHVLFMDRSYRNALIKTYSKLSRLTSEFGAKVIYVSATPLREVERVKMLEFTKSRYFVDVQTYKVKNTAYTIDRMIESNEWRSKYNRMIVFSNLSARKLYDKHYDWKDKMGIIHTDYNWTGDLDRVRENGVLDNDVTICTSLAFNGLNFNNENEKVLVVSEANSSSLAWQFIQQCGRLRKSVVDLRIVYSINESKKLSVEEQRNKCKAFKSVDEVLFNTDDDICNDEVYQSLKQIEEYVVDHSGFDAIVVDLKKEGYFRFDDKVIEDNEQCRMNNPLKLQADKLVRKMNVEEIENTCKDDCIPDNLKNYINIKSSMIDDLTNFKGYVVRDPMFNGMDLKNLLEAAARKQIDTVCDDLVEIATTINYNEEEWDYVTFKYNKAVDVWSGKTVVSDVKPDKIVVKELSSKMKRLLKIREDYKDCVVDGKVNGSMIIEKYKKLYLLKEAKANQKRSEINKLNGNVGGDHRSEAIKIMNLKTGEVMKFNSTKEATEALKIGPSTMNRLKKSGTNKCFKIL